MEAERVRQEKERQVSEAAAQTSSGTNNMHAPDDFANVDEGGEGLEDISQSQSIEGDKDGDDDDWDEFNIIDGDEDDSSDEVDDPFGATEGDTPENAADEFNMAEYIPVTGESLEGNENAEKPAEGHEST